jgi:D-alanine-D-alanine ligase-like ATP-grasp enzyme
VSERLATSNQRYIFMTGARILAHEACNVKRNAGQVPAEAGIRSAPKVTVTREASEEGFIAP